MITGREYPFADLSPSGTIDVMRDMLNHPCLGMIPIMDRVRGPFVSWLDCIRDDLIEFIDFVYRIVSDPEEIKRQITNSPFWREHLQGLPGEAVRRLNEVGQRITAAVPEQLRIHIAGVWGEIVNLLLEMCRSLLNLDIVQMLYEFAEEMINPFPGVWSDFWNFWGNVAGTVQLFLQGNFGGAVDRGLMAWDNVNTALGRLSGWIFAISVIIGAVAGGITGAAAGGVGAIPGAVGGAGSGVQVAGTFGIAIAASFIAQRIVRLIRDMQALITDDQAEPPAEEFSADEDSLLQIFAGLSPQQRERLRAMNEGGGPDGGGDESANCTTLPENANQEDGDADAPAGNENEGISTAQRYRQIAEGIITVSAAAVMILLGALATRFSTRLVGWLARRTAGLRADLFLFFRNVFAPLRRRLSPSIRQRIFGRNWNTWLRQRFGVTARDLMGRRRHRLGDEDHEVCLVRRADGSLRILICSDCKDFQEFVDEIYQLYSQVADSPLARQLSRTKF